MTKWQLCAAGLTLRDQINRAFPDRDRRSDGSVGDSSHQSRGSKSDHNPDSNGWVRAIDIDANLSDDAKAAYVLANQLRILARRDRRLSYIIFNRRFASRRTLWRFISYRGINPHEKHIHVSFTKKGDKDGKPFKLAILEN
jgi:hypothetical protein